MFGWFVARKICAPESVNVFFVCWLSSWSLVVTYIHVVLLEGIQDVLALTELDAGAAAALRLEGMPSEEFFLARAAVYKRCAVV